MKKEKIENNTKPTDVLIGGKVYTLQGADPEYLQRVASLLNEKIISVKNIKGYNNLDPEYKELLLNINIADEYFKTKDELEKQKQEMSNMEKELYAARHDLVNMKIKLETALKQNETLEQKNDTGRMNGDRPYGRY